MSYVGGKHHEGLTTCLVPARGGSWWEAVQMGALFVRQIHNRLRKLVMLVCLVFVSVVADSPAARRLP